MHLFHMSGQVGPVAKAKEALLAGKGPLLGMLGAYMRLQIVLCAGGIAAIGMGAVKRPLIQVHALVDA